MDYKEVESILKELVAKVKDIIKVQELLHSMTAHFSIPTVQFIQAQINHYGQAYAAVELFDSVKKRPNCFPKMVATIKYIGQEEVYEIFIKAIRKYFKNKQERLDQVLSLIHKTEQEIDITYDPDDDDDDAAAKPSSTSGNRIPSGGNGIHAGGGNGIHAGGGNGIPSGGSGIHAGGNGIPVGGNGIHAGGNGIHAGGGNVIPSGGSGIHAGGDNRIPRGASACSQAPGNDLSNNKRTKADQPVFQTPVKTNTPHSSSSVSSPDNNNPPGATGYTEHVYANQPSPSQIDQRYAGPSPPQIDQRYAGPSPPQIDQRYAGPSPSQIDQRYADSPISALKANVHNQLGMALDRRVPGAGDEPWWRQMILKGDLNISRKELKEIEKEKSPGVELLDLLDKRGYILRDLERLFTQFQMEEALNILREHQNKVIHGGERSREYLCSEQNNLNSSHGTKTTNSKDMNIGVLVPPVVPEEEDRSRINLPQPSENIDSSVRDLSSSSLTTKSSSLSSLQSFEENIRNIDDVYIKGTTAVQAHGDPTGENSQPNSEQDAQKLREDSIHQFNNDPDTLEATIGRDRTVDHDGDIGNIPFLSQLDSTEPCPEVLTRETHIGEPPVGANIEELLREINIGEPPVGENIEELPREVNIGEPQVDANIDVLTSDVNAVAPRSICIENLAELVDDASYTTRVVSVDPSISSTGSS